MALSAVMAGIFMRHGDALIPLTEAPYDAETVLQELVDKHPELLASDGRRRMLLVRREANVGHDADTAARWSLDHLLLDSDGVPVLVEVKRSTDSRIRREVVGQMLDYAAGAANWTVERVQGWLAERCANEHLDVDELLAQHTVDVDSFWENVATNLAARHLRLIFVADVIPPELRRVIEFLNDQMTKSEVLAFEVKQYLDPDGRQSIVAPTVIGQSEQARAVKSQRAKPLPWTLDLLLDAAHEHGGAAAAEVISAVARWAATQDDIRVSFGRGSTRQWGSLLLLLEGADNISPFVFWANGSAEITFSYMISAAWKPFDDEAARRELADRLNAIAGAHVAEERLALRPNIPLDVVAAALPQFLGIVDWTFDQARATLAEVEGAAPAGG